MQISTLDMFNFCIGVIKLALACAVHLEFILGSAKSTENCSLFSRLNPTYLNLLCRTFRPSLFFYWPGSLKKLFFAADLARLKMGLHFFGPCGSASPVQTLQSFAYGDTKSVLSQCSE